jgi:hypothetical protein
MGIINEFSYFINKDFSFKRISPKRFGHDEGFYKEAVSIVSKKVSSLRELHRRDQNIPFTTCMKQINACWLRIINFLREVLSYCDVINTKRGDVFLKTVDLTTELEGPHVIMDTILLSKEKLQEQLESLKVAWTNEFNDSME